MGQSGSYTMRSLSQLVNDWRQDRLLKGVIVNTSYLFSSNGISMILAMVQSIFAARLLGVSGVGVLGSVTAFATTVKSLLSFRMSELVVKYVGDDLSTGNKDRAAALVKIVALVEAFSSVIAYLVLFLAAPLAATLFAKDASFYPLFRFYGLYILATLVSETSQGIVQLDRRFKSQAVINLTQSVLTALIILGAYLSNAGMMVVLSAYLIGKIILGMGAMLLALDSLQKMLGKDWWRVKLTVFPEWRKLLRFAISTNLNATVNLVVRDSEQLWVAYFLSPTAAGLYKIGLAIVNLVVMPITPFINTTYPEMSRSVESRNWSQLRSLLRRVSIISATWTLGAGLFLTFFGKWLISIMYKPEFVPAYPILLTLLLGYGVANILFWNRPLLLSFGQPMYPLYVMLITGSAKVLLSFLLVPRFGSIAEAALLSGYFIISISLIVKRGFREIHNCETVDAGLEAV